MKTRPVCVGCGVFTIVLFLLLTYFPIRSYNVTTLIGKTITLEGKVESIICRNDTYQIFIKSRPESGYKAKGIIAYIKDGGDLLRIGSVVRVRGKVADFVDTTNDGQFSMKKYYQIRGMDFALKNACIISNSNSYNYLKHVLYQTNKKLCKTLNLILPEKYSGIMGAVLLGNKADLDDETKSLYQKAGISHALCISGLHISLIGMAVYELLKRLFGLNVKSGVVTAVFLLCYGMLCGNASATLRAITMFLIMIGGDVSGRSYDLCTALCISGMMALVVNPLLIFDSGFLLSYSAVLSVGTTLPFLKKLYKQYRKCKVINSILMSVSVSILTLPITLYFFYQYPIYSIFLNVLLIPFMSVLIFFGIFSLLVGLISTSAGTIIAIPCRLILYAYEKGCLFVEGLPGCSFICGRPSSIQIILYYTIIFLLVKFISINRRKSFWAGLCLALLVLTFTYTGAFEMTVLDVSQGSCTFIRTNKCTVLCDAGSSDVKAVGQYRVIPFLKCKGVRTIDAIFVSHGDEDHINALVELLDKEQTEIKIKRVFMTGNTYKSEVGSKLCKLCEEKGIKACVVGKGESFDIDKLSIKVLYPDKNMAGDTNELSMVLHVKYKDFSALIPGDLEGDAASLELLKAFRQKVFCYIVAHHGSKGASPEELLAVINPEISLISCGLNNSYGHPHKELLNRLEEINSQIYVTKDVGAITIKSDGRRCSVRTIKER